MATEKRLIDANELIEWLSRKDGGFRDICKFCNKKADCISCVIEHAIRYSPRMNAVEVVRCKDCKHYWKNINTPGYSGKCTSVGDDDFCSYGERRTNEDH